MSLADLFLEPAPIDSAFVRYVAQMDPLPLPKPLQTREERLERMRQYRKKHRKEHAAYCRARRAEIKAEQAAKETALKARKEVNRESQLTECLRECWGVMLLADTVVSDPKVKAAFLRVDGLCRKAGLDPKAGLRFLEPEELEQVRGDGR